jgi:hypothetical protein
MQIFSAEYSRSELLFYLVTCGFAHSFGIDGCGLVAIESKRRKSPETTLSEHVLSVLGRGVASAL